MTDQSDIREADAKDGITARMGLPQMMHQRDKESKMSDMPEDIQEAIAEFYVSPPAELPQMGQDNKESNMPETPEDNVSLTKEDVMDMLKEGGFVKKDDVVWYHETVIKGFVTLDRGFDDRGKYEEVKKVSTHTHQLLRFEGADEVIIRQYRSSNKVIDAKLREIESDIRKGKAGDRGGLKRLRNEYAREVFADMKELGVTLAVPTPATSGGKLTVYSVRKDGIVVDWNELATMKIMVMADKTPKRATLLAIQSSLGMELPAMLVEEPTPFNGRIISIAHFGDEEIKTILDAVGLSIPKRYYETLADGEAFIRESVRDQMIDEAIAHAESFMTGELLVAEINKLEKMRNCRTFYSGRALTLNGLIKGDFVVVPDDLLPADIYVYDKANIKTEIALNKEDKIFITMNPKWQGKSVRTNRQIVGIFGEFVFGENLCLPKSGFQAKLNRDLNMFMKGQLPTHTSNQESSTGEATKSVDQMIDMWTEKFGSLIGSSYLMGMQADGYVNRMTPTKKEARNRRMPVPFAKSYSMRTMLTYIIAEGVEASLRLIKQMRQDQIHVDKDLGVIFGINMIASGAFSELGGADLDDTVEVHFRLFEGGAHRFFPVSGGEIGAIILRNPVGIVSDGTVVAKEHWIASLSEETAIRVKAQYKNKLPVLNLNGNMPLCTQEVELPEDILIPTHSEKQDGWTKEYTVQRFMQYIEMDHGVFGRYVNLMIAFAHLDIPFKHYARTEVFADISQQTANANDLEKIGIILDEYQEHLINEVNAREIVVDEHLAKSVGIKRSVETGDGVFSDFVDTHRGMVADWQGKANKFIEKTRELNARPLAIDAWVTTKPGGDVFVPAAIARLVRDEREFIDSTGQGRTDLYAAQRTIIGNKAVKSWKELIETGAVDAKSMRTRIADAFFYGMNNTVGNGKYLDRGLYWGNAINWLLSALDGYTFERPSVAKEDRTVKVTKDYSGLLSEEEQFPTVVRLSKRDALQTQAEELRREFGDKEFTTIQVTILFDKRAGEVMRSMRDAGIVDFYKEANGRYTHWFN